MEKTLSGETFNEFECNHFIHQVYEGIVRQVFVCVSHCTKVVILP